MKDGRRGVVDDPRLDKLVKRRKSMLDEVGADYEALAEGQRGRPAETAGAPRGDPRARVRARQHDVVQARDADSGADLKGGELSFRASYAPDRGDHNGGNRVTVKLVVLLERAWMRRK
jgi:hypothetical protein